MTRVIVASDSHRNVAALRRCLACEPDAAALIFLGDGLGDLNQVKGEFPDLRVYAVRGNCDYQQSFPSEGLIPFEGKLIFYTHGHNHGVKLGPEQLQLTAAARGADLALYGHTHRAAYAPGDDEWPPAVNPGSVGEPRDARGRTFAVLTLEKDKPIHVQLYRLPDLTGEEPDPLKF